MIPFNHMITNKCVVVVIICVFIFTAHFSPGIISPAQAQEKCDTAIPDAEKKYNTGRFDEAISILESCLPGDFTEKEKGEAYRIIALAYHAKDYLEQARTAVKKLLELVPDWEPDPIQDPPQFQRMVEEMKQKMETQKQPQEQPPVEEEQLMEIPAEPPQQLPTAKKGGSKKFLFIGGGVAIAGALVVVLVAGGGAGAGDGGGGGGNRLPFPPPLPPNQ